MKKLLLVFMSLVLGFTALSFGCSSPAPTVNVVLPDGAPSLALVSLFDQTDLGGKKVTFEIVPADTIAQKVSSGAADVAIIPTNAAANLYNKGIDIKLAATSVQGLLYMVGKTAISSFDELKGKVIYSIGQNNTPEFVFKYVLTGGGIDAADIVTGETASDGKITICFKSDGSEILPLLIQNRADYAILGEPVATTAKTKANLVTVLDLQSEWSKLNGSASYPQACLVVSGRLASDKTFVNAFISAAKQNDDWIIDNSSEVLAKLQAKNSLLTVNFTADIIRACNIRTVSAKDAKADVIAYLTVLKDYNAAFIGGKLPDDNFYCIYED